MLGCLVDMALASWEKVLTPKEPQLSGLMAALASMAEFQRQMVVIRGDGGVRLNIQQVATDATA